ncbi:MAG: hypothetical protein ACI837_002988 [Crocinitomicaceae bacterium]
MIDLEGLPELGVGIIYSSSIASIDFPKGLIDTLVVEPQTLCIRNSQDQLRLPESVFNEINNLPFNKLVHSIGAPVGGTLKPQDEQINLINYCTKLFDSPWVSEHLSFNAITEFNTGFFLPPCQTDKGLEMVIQNIKNLQARLDRPLILETGVNYLKPNSSEMEDGEFVARICEATGCGILLDIHNLFANQLNGRQSIEEFLNAIPLDHVIEIHIAGGTELNGLWLDSHSGPIDKRLLAITAETLPDLKNLKEITYEIFDSYIPLVGDALITTEMERVRELWENRKKQFPIQPNERMPKSVMNLQELNRDFDPSEWEILLGSSVIGREVDENLLHKDERIELYQKLITEFRASMVVKIYKLTSRYMALLLSMDVFMTILGDFWKHYPPEQLSHKEAHNFATYLKKKNYQLPWLDRLLDYEIAILETLMDETDRIVYFDADPTPMFSALSQWKLPEQIGAIGNYEIEITAEATKIEWTVL